MSNEHSLSDLDDELYEAEAEKARLTEEDEVVEETTEERKARQEREQKEDYIQGLRDLADWLEATPSAPTELYRSIIVSLKDKDHAVRLAKEAGSIHKEYSGDRLLLEKWFGDIIRYKATVSRKEVCRVKEVKKVEKEVPHYPAPVYVNEVVDETEWECDPLLAPTEE